MSRVFQRAGRSGWYLGVSVPKSIRKKLGRNEVHKKVGYTHKEAFRLIHTAAKLKTKFDNYKMS